MGKYEEEFAKSNLRNMKLTMHQYFFLQFATVSSVGRGALLLQPSIAAGRHRSGGNCMAVWWQTTTDWQFELSKKMPMRLNFRSVTRKSTVLKEPSHESGTFVSNARSSHEL